jgi:hypothetical protein
MHFVPNSPAQKPDVVAGNVERSDRSYKNISVSLRGETMAYALQHAIYNIAANVYEPIIGGWVQRKYSPGHAGNYKQNFLGEIAGDITGAGALILAEAFASGPLHICTRTMRSWIDPFYTSVAHRVFADQKDNPNYDKLVNDWKIFQERNLVRSALMLGTGIAGNIITQKTLLKNPAPAKIILLGKAASATVTTALGLAIRFAAPDAMKKTDKWLSEKLFIPLLDDEKPGKAHPAATHVDRVLTRNPELELVR